MNFKIGICDDDAPQRESLKEIAASWAQLQNHTLLIREYPSSEAFLFGYSEEKDFDILLLDIEMPGINGVDLAKKIRQENDTVQIIFVTGYSDYISEGYEVAALHYLMKPVKAEKLQEVLSRAAEKREQDEKCLNLLLSGEMVRIPMHEIKYLDVQKNYVTVHGKEDYTVRQSLGEFERELDHRFFRVGRSMILNLTKVSRVTKQEVHLSDGTVLLLPRGAYEDLNRAIIERT